MAPSGTATVKCCSMRDDDESAMATDGGYGHDHQPFAQNLAPIVGAIGMVQTIESSDGDADEELSDGKEGEGGLFWESDEEAALLPLPGTAPPQRRNRRWKALDQEYKKYASESEAQETMRKRKGWGRGRGRGRGRMREGSRKGGWDRTGDAKKVDCREVVMVSEAGMGIGGGDESVGTEESEGGGGGGGGGGVVVITRPKGGMRPLCMDMEEVKACKDLGFELEHQGTLEIMPSRLSLSLSGSNIDTSSGGNSPIANWRISSPG